MSRNRGPSRVGRSSYVVSSRALSRRRSGSSPVAPVKTRANGMFCCLRRQYISCCGGGWRGRCGWSGSARAPRTPPRIRGRLNLRTLRPCHAPANRRHRAARPTRRSSTGTASPHETEYAHPFTATNTSVRVLYRCATGSEHAVDVAQLVITALVALIGLYLAHSYRAAITRNDLSRARSNAGARRAPAPA